MKILIIAALPQEYAHLKRFFPSWRRIGKSPPKFAFELPDKKIRLLESGMGARSAIQALLSELSDFSPDLAIFSGFAGGLHPDLEVGAVCFASRARKLSSEGVLRSTVPEELSHFLRENHIRPVLALSSDAPADKQTLSSLTSGGPAILDMETAMAAETAMARKVPFLCLRAISDAVGHDLGFDLRDIADDRGRIKLIGVLLTIIKRPTTLKAFYLAWRRSNRAAKNLGGALAALLKLPVSELSKMAAGVQWAIDG